MLGNLSDTNNVVVGGGGGGGGGGGVGVLTDLLI